MPIFNFFHGGFNLERTERKSIHSHGGTFVKLDLSSDCSTKNYYFVLSGYHGNVSRGSLPALISLEEPVIPLCVWTIAFCIKNGKCILISKKNLRNRCFCKDRK